MSRTEHQFAFEDTSTHKGLKNAAGENNCFLNVTIQALWHLGPFRANMKQLMAAILDGQFSPKFVDQSFILALCNLFIQYEFAEEQVLPPDELRLLLGSLNEKFGVGKIADANEALDTILQRIHNEFAFLCPLKCKCLAHQTFGVQMLEQYVCGLCGATSEPRISDHFLLYFQSMEFLIQAAQLNQLDSTDQSALKSTQPLPHAERRIFAPMSQMLRFATWQFIRKPTAIQPLPSSMDNTPLHVIVQQNELIQKLKNRLFGLLLRQCMISLGQHSCPSTDDAESRGRYRCNGRAAPRFSCLDNPLSLALSFGWTNTRESSDNIHSFLSLVPTNVFLQDIFSAEDAYSNDGGLPPAYRSHGNDSALLAYLTSREKSSALDYVELEKYVSSVPNGPSYALRGMICYYGLHYVSIFLDNQDDNVFLLFDDQRVRPIGNWADVIDLCVKALYQPVLLIYELEDREERSMSNKASFIVNYSQILKETKAEPASIAEKEVEEEVNDSDNHTILSPTSSVNTTDAIVSTSSFQSSCNNEIAPPRIRYFPDSIQSKRGIEASSTNFVDRGDAQPKSNSRNIRGSKDNWDYSSSLDSAASKANILLPSVADSKSTRADFPVDMSKHTNDSGHVPIVESQSIAEIRRRYNLPGVLSVHPNDRGCDTAFGSHLTKLQRRQLFSPPVKASIITSWRQKPLRYTCNVPVYYINGQVFLGIQLSVNTETMLLVVTTFAPHPVTKRPTWIESHGRVQLMDQLISLNGFSLLRISVEEFARMLKREVSIAKSQQQGGHIGSVGDIMMRLDSDEDSTKSAISEEPDIIGKVRIEFQSEYMTVTYYRCPECLENIPIDAMQQQSLIHQFGKKAQVTLDDSMFVTLTCSSCKCLVRAVDFPYTKVNL
jgi:hypothetical protein